jgi:hypothetical protein
MLYDLFSISVVAMEMGDALDLKKCVSRTAIGVPNNRGKCPFQKIIKRKLTTHKPQNTLRVVTSQSRRAHGPESRNGPPKRTTAVPLGRISVSLEDWAPRRQNPASLEGLMPPRANLRLARGPDPPSGESPPRSRARRPPRARLRLARGRLRPTTPHILPRPEH